jgi:BirA family biotin operon repressor/biotin-[acetyl-CoA-carboxylase] ligase
MLSKSETPGLPNSRFVSINLVSETGSTNADMTAEAALGAPEGSVLIAQRQKAGRGRQGRSWLNADGSLLAMSWLMRPECDPQDWGLIPLLTGVAVLSEVKSLGVDASLKWPNDVLVGPRKLAGILCESSLGSKPSVVVGVGLNIGWGSDRVPEEISSVATSLGENCDEPPGPVELGRGILGRFEAIWQAWHGDHGQLVNTTEFLQSYVAECWTLQQAEITFLKPDGSKVRGQPIRIDSGGGLVLQTASGEQLMTAGEAHHLRT